MRNLIAAVVVSFVFVAATVTGMNGNDSPPVHPAHVTACNTVDLGPIVGPTTLCAGQTGELSSDGCDGGSAYAQAEVNAVAQYEHAPASITCGNATYRSR